MNHIIVIVLCSIIILLLIAVGLSRSKLENEQEARKRFSEENRDILRESKRKKEKAEEAATNFLRINR